MEFPKNLQYVIKNISGFSKSTIKLSSDRETYNKGDNIRVKLNSSVPIQYPSSSKLSTEQSRTIQPVWTARELEQVNWNYPLMDPQENVFFRFENNISTRVLEKDTFTQKRENNNLFSI